MKVRDTMGKVFYQITVRIYKGIQPDSKKDCFYSNKGFVIIDNNELQGFLNDLDLFYGDYDNNCLTIRVIDCDYSQEKLLFSNVIDSLELPDTFILKSFYPNENKRIHITFKMRINNKMEQNEIQAKMKEVWGHYGFEL